jgi:quinol monooxygenase YgiN
MFLILTTAALSLAAQQQEHPALARVRASVQDPTKPFVMIITFRVKEGQGPKFEAAFAKAIAKTRKEKGCRAYDLSRNEKVPGEYVLYERWDGVEALAGHLKSEHIVQLGKDREGTTEGNSEVKVLVPVGE